MILPKVLGWTWKYKTPNLSDLQKDNPEANQPFVCFRKQNLLAEQQSFALQTILCKGFSMKTEHFDLPKL